MFNNPKGYEVFKSKNVLTVYWCMQIVFTTYYNSLGCFNSISWMYLINFLRRLFAKKVRIPVIPVHQFR